MTNPTDNGKLKALLRPATNRILIIGTAIGLFFLLIFSYQAGQYMKTAEQQRLIDLKQKVQLARNSIDPVIIAFRAGRLSRDAALGEIRGFVRRMVYDDHNGPNYIFMSSYDGIMLVQPFEPGKEMSNVRDLKDSYGVFIIQELIKTARSTEKKGYVAYHYKTPDATVPQEKISYVMGIPELSCYIGTGAYMGDVRIKERSFLYHTAGLITVLLTLLFLLVSFSKKEILRQNLQLKKENDEHKITEKKLRLTQYAVDHSATPIIRFNPDSSIAYSNRAACRQLGYSRKELLALTIPDIDPIWTLDYWEKEGLPMLREKRIATFESVNMHKNGNRFPVEVLCYDTEFEGQEYFFAFITDITERKQAEKRQIQSRKMEALGTLAGGIAHDFNNILSGIFGYTQLAARITGDNPKAQKYLHHVNAASERAAALVQQILGFSRQDKSQMQPLNIGSIIKEALKLIRASLPANIEISEDMMPNPDPILADPIQIHQVAMNLCTNAYHAMKETGGVLRVDLLPVVLAPEDIVNYEDIPAGRYLELTVSDNGHGIAPHILPRVFEPYFTTKEVGTGTGMGLSTVHGIVKNHGGTVSVYSEAGVGTTFKALFPLAGQEAPKELEAGDSLPGGSEHLLFVDDENVLVEFGAEFLGGLGYTVKTCTSSVTALEAFKADPEIYDMVITDLTMPEMTGDLLAGKIRKIRPGIPIILCTGFSTGMIYENQKTAGIDCILMKPLNIHELSNTIRDLLDKRGLNR